MAISIISPLLYPGPNLLSFAKNPVVFKFQAVEDGTGNLFAAVGAYARMDAGTSDKFAAGETMTITYVETDGTTEAVTFTAAAPYTAEDEIPDDTYSGTITQYWEAVRAKIQAHHRIAPFFTVERTGPLIANRIYVRAIDTSPDFSVTVANTAGFTNNAFAATADITPENYVDLLEVYVEQTYLAGNFRLAAQLENTPNESGFLWFDLSSILEAECRAGLTEPVVPVWGVSDTSLADNMRRFYFRYTEKYGSPATVQEWQYEQLRTVLNGGISQSLFAAGDFLAGLNVDDAFLTWMPDGRKIGLSQPEFLAWYNWDTESRPIRLEMQWYDIDTGEASTATQHFTVLNVDPKTVALIPANPTLLGLDSQADAYKYRVRVVYLDDALIYQPLSQWRTYYIDRDYFESERYLQYLNGFGTPECWRCTGEWGKKINIARAVADTPLLPDYNEFAADNFQYSRKWEVELIYRTGYITRAEAEALQEMLIAGEVYDVSEEGYIPIRLITNSFAVTDTNQDLHAYQFSAQLRLDMRNYSKKKLEDLASGAWQEPGGQAWFDAMLVEWGLPS